MIHFSLDKVCSLVANIISYSIKTTETTSESGALGCLRNRDLIFRTDPLEELIYIVASMFAQYFRYESWLIEYRHTMKIRRGEYNSNICCVCPNLFSPELKC